MFWLGLFLTNWSDKSNPFKAKFWGDQKTKQ